MNDEVKDLDIEQPVDEQADTQRVPGDESEFKVSVRKLELPVKPRGVLAE